MGLKPLKTIIKLYNKLLYLFKYSRASNMKDLKLETLKSRLDGSTGNSAQNTFMNSSWNQEYNANLTLTCLVIKIRIKTSFAYACILELHIGCFFKKQQTFCSWNKVPCYSNKRGWFKTAKHSTATFPRGQHHTSMSLKRLPVSIPSQPVSNTQVQWTDRKRLRSPYCIFIPHYCISWKAIAKSFTLLFSSQWLGLQQVHAEF